MEDVNIILERARALNTDKKWDEVVRFLPESVLKTYKNSDLYAEKAQALWFLKKFVECKNTAEKSLAISSNAKAFNYLGNVSFEERNYPLAIGAYCNAIELDKNFQASYYGLGVVFRRKRKFDVAKDYFEKAILINPLNPIPYNGLGNLLNDLNNFSLAEENFKKSLEIDPNFSLAYNGLGVSAAGKQDFNFAIECYNKAIKIDQSNPSPYYNMALLYVRLKKFDEAKDYFNKALKIKKDYASALNGLGSVFKKTGEETKAEEFYKKAIQAEKLFDIPYYNLGLLYNEKDKLNEAKKYFELYVNYSDDVESFIYKNALSKIDEINKKIENSSYKKISEIIEKIKLLVKFEEECITHYTSITTAQFLILKNSLFRLSEGTFLNDTSEGEELFKFLELSVTDTKINNQQSEIFTKRPFIGSFVDAAKNNDLTLWRMYGKEGLEEAKGCSLTINIKEFKEEIKSLLSTNGEANLSNNLDVEFYKVIYRRDEEFCFSGSTFDSNKLLAELMAELKAEYTKFLKKKTKGKNEELEIVELLNEIAYLFKSIEYQYENEIRLVINEAVGFDKKIDFKEENFTPSMYPSRVYIELIPITPLLKTITIGPKVEKGEEWASTFHYFLSNKGFKPEIHISKLPFK